MYLNIAETGTGTGGANAGAIRYFNHDASRLSPTEAAGSPLSPASKKRGNARGVRPQTRQHAVTPRFDRPQSRRPLRARRRRLAP